MRWNMNCSVDVRDKVGKEVVRIQKTAKAVAALDVFASLALLQNETILYVRRLTKGVLDIKNGRHPVVEQMIENDMFIANDTYLDNRKKVFPSSPDRIWLVNLRICVRRPSSF